MLLVALQEVPTYGAMAVGWIALTVAATWPRFPRETVPQFLGGMRDLWHHLKQSLSLPLSKHIIQGGKQ